MSSSVALLFHQQAPNCNSIWKWCGYCCSKATGTVTDWTKLNTTINYKVKNIGNNIKWLNPASSSTCLICYSVFLFVCPRVLGIMASQRPPSSMGRPMSRSGSVVPGAGRPPTAIQPPPTAMRVATGVSHQQHGYAVALRYYQSECVMFSLKIQLFADSVCFCTPKKWVPGFTEPTCNTIDQFWQEKRPKIKWTLCLWCIFIASCFFCNLVCSYEYRLCFPLPTCVLYLIWEKSWVWGLERVTWLLSDVR